VKIVHLPVMLQEVVEALKVRQSGIYVDGTIGPGGHAEGILKGAEGCTLIGIDQDKEAIEIAKEMLKAYDIHLVKGRFSNMVDIVKSLGYKQVDGILLDLGVSSFQLKSEGRGFSFWKDEPLDMRMDREQELTATKIVNEYPERELSDLLWRYGEERFSRRIARAIVSAREKKPIMSCRELAQIIEKAVGRRGRIHPATKTFQALRIEVNKELNELSIVMDTAPEILKSGGRFCVLSYHSLEDRIVKHSFKKLSDRKLISIITKRPLVPKKEEKRLNPSSRSAKLRVAEKL